MHPGYIAEQAIWIGSAIALCGWFMRQLLLGRHVETVGKLKHSYHALGLIGSCLFLIRSVDPHGFHGILERFLLYQYPLNYLTTVLFSAAACGIYFSLRSFNMLLSTAPRLTRLTELVM